MGIITEVKKRVSEEAICTSCNKRSCKITLAMKGTNQLIVDMDKIHVTGKKCDYLIFREHTAGDEAIAIEMKSGGNINKAAD
jgi:hypothetical protein